jgi:hypothetical protein
MTPATQFSGGAIGAWESDMKKPAWVVGGVIVALAGLLFTLQGTGVMKGSAMSNSTFWAVAGPVVLLVGLAVAGVGVRGGTRR